MFFVFLVLAHSLIRASAVSGANDGRNSAVQIIDSAFQQEAYLNKQISDSLHASDSLFSERRSTDEARFSPSSLAHFADAEQPMDPVPESDAQQFRSGDPQSEVDSSELATHVPFAQVRRPAPKVKPMALRREVSLRMGARRLHDKLATVSYPLALTQGLAEDEQGEDIIALRPGAADGVADVVSFGIFTKQFYGTDLKRNKFTADVVFSLKWKDSRISGLMPDGLKELSLSWNQAAKRIWMPEVVITNRDIRKLETISTAITIFKTGEVFKVERAVVVCNNIFELKEYPFDTQHVKVKIASSKYMLDEVVLAPDEDKSTSGASSHAMDGSPYKLKSHKVFAVDEVDGALKKSRGVLEIAIERNTNFYEETHLYPAGMLLVISWGVFFFPFQQPFITPRLALSILALLSFTQFVLKSVAMLPEGAPNNWNDAFNQQVQSCMFMTIILNIYSEIIKHQWKLDDYGKTINDHAKVLIPFLSITVVLIVLTAGKYKWLSLTAAVILTKILDVVVMGAYLGVSALGLPAAKQARDRKELEERAAEELKKIGKEADDLLKRKPQRQPEQDGADACDAAV